MNDGSEGYTGEGFVNIPLTDNSALRLVGWYVDSPGYIDNVQRTITLEAAGVTKDNADLVEEDFNTATSAGMRAALRIDLGDNWTLTPGFMMQSQDTDGVYDHDPEDIGDLEAARYFPEYYEDDWYQASLTLEGQIGDLDLVYAGAYLDMDQQSVDDYTHYAQYWDNYLRL